MKKALHIAKEVISWAILVAMIIAFAFSVYSNVTNENKGEGAFLLGYRPVLVLTGSMEPYMMTNGLALTKQVKDISELAAGDVITYHIESESGKTLRITHRITEIDGEYIYTKGDNNYVDDGIALTMDNVEAKVVGVTNITAWIVAKWQSSTAGKIMLIAYLVGAILLFICLRMLIKSFFAKKKAAKEVTAETPIEEPLEPESGAEANCLEEAPGAFASEPEGETIKQDEQ